MNMNASTPIIHLACIKLLALAAMLISSVSCAEPDSGANDAAGDTAQTVLITGANRGIGLELAQQYSTAGWQVIGTARRPDAADELRGLGVGVMELDVTDQGSVNRLAQNLGDRPIDVLINNAGIFPRSRSVSDIDFDEFNRTLAVNTVGPVRVTQALLSNLRTGTLKKVVNITSNLGSITENTNGGSYGYRESKAALNMFTRSLAAELRQEGFICIVLHPGWVQTDMGGSGAPTTVEDSVSGIRKVIDSLTPDDSGTFWSHEGDQLPW